MIFMSQSGLMDPKQQAAWDQWYLAHLHVMLTVEGIESAQRFALLRGDAAPSLAIYTIASPEVFRDAYYLSIRGMGQWLSFIDRDQYHRNLFAGLDLAPEVPDTGLLLVADRDEPEPMLGESPGSGWKRSVWTVRRHIAASRWCRVPTPLVCLTLTSPATGRSPVDSARERVAGVVNDPAPVIVMGQNCLINMGQHAMQQTLGQDEHGQQTQQPCSFGSRPSRCRSRDVVRSS